MSEEYIVRVLANDDCITEGELIRCRDCVHKPAQTEWGAEPPNHNEDSRTWDWTCPYLCSDVVLSHMPPDDGFCHKAERRTNEVD